MESALVLLLSGLLMFASSPAALAHAVHDHSDDAAIEYADPVLFDGDVINDCQVVGADMILWELTGSDAVTYAELHIDEPEPSVTSRTAAPYIFLTPRYEFALIEADVDRIVGDIAADARVTATVCDNSAMSWLPIATGVVGLAVGVLAGRARNRTPSAA